jgi:hypothetical protein
MHESRQRHYNLQLNTGAVPMPAMRAICGDRTQPIIGPSLHIKDGERGSV